MRSRGRCRAPTGVAVRIPRLQHGRSAIVAARAIVPSTSNIAAASGSWRARVQRIDDCIDMFPLPRLGTDSHYAKEDEQPPSARRDPLRKRCQPRSMNLSTPLPPNRASPSGSRWIYSCKPSGPLLASPSVAGIARRSKGSSMYLGGRGQEQACEPGCEQASMGPRILHRRGRPTANSYITQMDLRRSQFCDLGLRFLLPQVGMQTRSMDS